jgi:hypothetical protein
MKCSKCQQPAEYLLFAYRETFNSRRRLLIPDPYACGAHVDEVAKEIRDSFTGFTRVHAERLQTGLTDFPEPAFNDSSGKSIRVSDSM